MTRTLAPATGFAVLLSLIACPCQTSEHPGSTTDEGPEPTLAISKDTYALGEAIFFWTGVRSAHPMSPESYEPCEVEIVDPDLRSSSHFLPWPTDGDGTHGWSGGSGVAPDEAIPGVYVARVTCGDKTIEGRFTVEHTPVLEQIEARFDFMPGCDDRPSDTTVTLVVVNHSDQRLAISRPGALMDNAIWFHSKRQQPPAMCDAFFPVEALGYQPTSAGDGLVETMTFDSLEQAPHFVLLPAESLALSFCMSAGRLHCSNFWPPTWIRVVTTQQVLIGTPTGPSSGLGPIRLAITGEYQPGE